MVRGKRFIGIGPKYRLHSHKSTDVNPLAIQSVPALNAKLTAASVGKSLRVH